MEVVLTGVNPFGSDQKSVLKIRPVTPKTPAVCSKSISPDTLESNQTSDYTHSILFTGNLDQIESVQNSVAMKLVRTQKDKQNGMLTLVFDFIFWPSRSFM